MSKFFKITALVLTVTMSASNAFAASRYINDNRVRIDDRSITNNDNRQFDQRETTINDNRIFINDHSVTNNDNRVVHER